MGLKHRALLLPPCVLSHLQESLLQLEDDVVSLNLAASLPPPANITMCHTHFFYLFMNGMTVNPFHAVVSNKSIVPAPKNKDNVRCEWSIGRMITGMGKLQYSEKDLLQFHFIHHKSHTSYPENEPRPLQ